MCNHLCVLLRVYRISFASNLKDGTILAISSHSPVCLCFENVYLFGVRRSEVGYRRQGIIERGEFRRGELLNERVNFGISVNPVNRLQYTVAY